MRKDVYLMHLDILVTYGQIMHFCCTEYIYCKFGALVYRNIQLHVYNVTKYRGISLTDILRLARTLKAKNLQKYNTNLTVPYT